MRDDEQDLSSQKFVHAARIDFGEVVHQALTEALIEVLGSSGAQSVIFHLKLASEKDPAVIHEKLVFMFREGAVSLEQVVMRKLLEKLEAPNPLPSEGDFATYADLAKKFFEKKTRTERHQH